MHNQDLGRVAVVARGIYDPLAEYERLDAVSYNGSSYLVRKHCQGVEPAEGEYYMLMAKAGDSTAANAAAEKALAAAERADSASARANTAAGNADQKAKEAGAAAASANAAAGNANTAAAGASSAKQEAETAAAAANNAAASANQNAKAAATATSAANAAASRADDAASGANTARDAAGAAAEAANAAAAAAQNVVDSVQPNIAQIKQTLAAHSEALGNRIKKFYTGNLGAVNIADSDDGAVRDLVIGGRSEQFTTTGANILPYPYYDTTVTVNGVTFTDNGDGSITMNGTATANAEFAFLADNKPGFMDGMVANHPGEKVTFKGLGDGAGRESYFIFAQGFVNNTYVYGSDVTSAVLSEIVYVRQMFVRVLAGATVDNVTIKPMIALGDSIATYEPFTGGAPSPSPDYPQEIKSVENCAMTVSNADGTETQTAPVLVTLRGVGAVRDELYVYADGSGKLVQRFTCEKPIKTDIKPDRESDVAISVILVGALSQKSIQNAIRSNRFIQGNTLTPYKIACYNNVVYASFPKDKYPTYDDAANYVRNLDFYVMYKHNPIETALTAEQVKALYDLRTYYGGTNISYQSENGVEPVVNFDYACALENFVEYIKAAQGDDRKFIYDMDERMTDAEYVAALAYVNSEYAAALTELEV